VTQPGQVKLTWNVLRPDKSIARQIPVCDVCHFNLSKGVRLESIVAMNRQKPSPAPPPSEKQVRSQQPIKIRRDSEQPLQQCVTTNAYKLADVAPDHALVTIPIKSKPSVQQSGPRRTLKLSGRDKKRS
jgi:hypothetical protein